MPSRPIEYPAAPRVSAEPSRKTFFSFLEEKVVARKIKIVKKIFLRGRPPLCGGWRRASESQEFLIK